MARFYSKIKSLELTNESKPIEGLTKQNWNESLYLIRGKDEGIPAWHYILVPHYKINLLKNHQSGSNIDCNQFGNIIQYKDNNGFIYPSSGWGINPNYSFQTWIQNQYGDRPFDENTQFEYTEDDIRICRIQRSRFDELIGIYRYYNKQGNFHYLKLINNDDENSLAYRGGIKNYDRFIYLNGINIENESLEEIKKHFENKLNLPIEIVVCNPSTYHYYKSNNIQIHSNLSTIIHCKPVFNYSIEYKFNSQYYFIVQLQNDKSISIISQSFIFKSPDLIEINDICFIYYQQIYQKGIILFKGTKDECEHFEINDNKLIFEMKVNVNNNKGSILEDLPNELFYEIFDYLNIEDIHNSFNNLNIRLNNILYSLNNLSLIYNENLNENIINIYHNRITNLIIDRTNSFDLKLFSNINSLIILNRNSDHIKQIESKIIPHLKYLSFKLKSNYKYPIELIDQIFSNKFKNLINLNIGLISRSINNNWLISPNIKKIKIYSNQIQIIQDILIICPNLIYFQIHLLFNKEIKDDKSSLLLINHQLEKFILITDRFQFEFDLFNLMSNLRYLYLQIKCKILFNDFIKNIYNRLNSLEQFHCFIKEILPINQRINNLNEIYQLSTCFKQIQCIKENEEYRIFSTD